MRAFIRASQSQSVARGGKANYGGGGEGKLLRKWKRSIGGGSEERCNLCRGLTAKKSTAGWCQVKADLAF